MAAARSLWDGKPLSFNVRNPKLELLFHFKQLQQFSISGKHCLCWWRPGDVEACAVTAENRAKAAHVSRWREVHHSGSIPVNADTCWVWPQWPQQFFVFFKKKRRKKKKNEKWQMGSSQTSWRQAHVLGGFQESVVGQLLHHLLGLILVEWFSRVNVKVDS